MKRIVSLLSVTLLLPACAPAPIVSPPAQVQCPQLPPLAKEIPEPSFQDRMQSFLSGKLPAPTGSVQRSPSATASTKAPGQ